MLMEPNCALRPQRPSLLLVYCWREDLKHPNTGEGRLCWQRPPDATGNTAVARSASSKSLSFPSVRAGKAAELLLLLRGTGERTLLYRLQAGTDTEYRLLVGVRSRRNASGGQLRRTSAIHPASLHFTQRSCPFPSTMSAIYSCICIFDSPGPVSQVNRSTPGAIQRHK